MSGNCYSRLKYFTIIFSSRFDRKYLKKWIQNWDWKFDFSIWFWSDFYLKIEWLRVEFSARFWIQILEISVERDFTDYSGWYRFFKLCFFNCRALGPKSSRVSRALSARILNYLNTSSQNQTSKAESNHSAFSKRLQMEPKRNFSKQKWTFKRP